MARVGQSTPPRRDLKLMGGEGKEEEEEEEEDKEEEYDEPGQGALLKSLT
jgi:ribosomal protein L12E/L44/L45/RPP1/RPP2